VLALSGGQVAWGAAGLAWLAASDPLVAGAGPQAVYLGHRAGRHHFAADLGAGTEPPPGARWADLRQELALFTGTDGAIAATAKGILGWHDSHGFCAKCGAPSAMAEGGWQRLCPACGTSHFPRTDPVVIMNVIHRGRILLGRSAAWPQGMYSCLAGFMEPGETVEAAVRREVAEEAGVEVGKVRLVTTQPWPFPASLMIGCHAEATGDGLRLDPAELDDALWVSRERLMEALAGQDAVLKPARAGSIARHLMASWVKGELD
jgi:NAD+ diphosphatase